MIDGNGYAAHYISVNNMHAFDTLALYMNNNTYENLVCSLILLSKLLKFLY